MKDCIFCKIARGDLGTKFYFENEDFVIFEDLSKQAKKHYLLVPKNHYANFSEMEYLDSEKLGKMLHKLPTLVNELGLENGYRVVINQGSDAGQTVFHLHIHLLGGEKLGEFGVSK